MTTADRKWRDLWGASLGQDQAYKTWFSEHKDELPTGITSMISVGPGCGDLDVDVITKSLPQLESYIGVEPDADHLDALTATMAARCPNVQFQGVAEPLDMWQGPSEPVDLIVAVQVLHYLSDPVAVLTRLYSWLEPGGVLVIGHSHDDNIYANVAKAAGLEGDYWMPRLKEDIKQAGFYHYKEYKMEYSADNQNELPEEMVTYYYKHCLHKVVHSDDDVQKCVDIFRTKWENSDRHQTLHNGVIILDKPYCE